MKTTTILKKAAITGTLTSKSIQASDSNIVFFVTNSTEDPLTFKLQTGLNDVYFDVLDPYTDVALTFIVAAGANASKTFSDVSFNGEYRVVVTTTGATGLVTVKATY